MGLHSVNHLNLISDKLILPQPIEFCNTAMPIYRLHILFCKCFLCVLALFCFSAHTIAYAHIPPCALNISEVLDMLGMFDTIFQSLMFLISFISGNNSFPKPLSAAEEKMYIERMAQGDTEARDKLIEHNLRLVAHIAKKYTVNFRDSEDLISLGTIGLIKGINSFDGSKGTRLATYAARCIENEILMLMRSSKKSQGDVSLNDPIGTDKEGNQILLIDIIGTDEDDVIKEIESKIQTKKLYKNIDKLLDEREKEIIRLRYGLWDGSEKTQREIAKSLGISRSYVSRIEKKAISKLKKGICDDEPL